MEDKIERLMLSLIMAVVMILISLVGAFPLKWCWNHAMPYVSNGVLPELTWSHAFCLMWVCRSLIKAIHVAPETKKKEK